MGVELKESTTVLKNCYFLLECTRDRFVELHCTPVEREPPNFSEDQHSAEVLHCCSKGLVPEKLHYSVCVDLVAINLAAIASYE